MILATCIRTAIFSVKQMSFATEAFWSTRSDVRCWDLLQLWRDRHQKGQSKTPTSGQTVRKVPKSQQRCFSVVVNFDEFCGYLCIRANFWRNTTEIAWKFGSGRNFRTLALESIDVWWGYSCRVVSTEWACKFSKRRCMEALYYMASLSTSWMGWLVGLRAAWREHLFFFVKKNC